MSEARSEHEFKADGQRWRVVYDGGGWVFEIMDPSVRYWIDPAIGDEMNYTAMLDIAAEIARLRGLVPPGGENDSRGENG